jgi:hypothetical protein
MTKTIAFGGHFAVGEKTTAAERVSLSAAVALGCDLGILVNDIDVKRKMLLLTFLGKDAFLSHYGLRVKCGASMPICRRLDGSSISEVVDWDFYETAKVELTRAEIRGPRDERLDDLANKLATTYIKARTQEFPNAKVFTEKALRNYARSRVDRRKINGQTWKDLLDEKEMDKLVRESGKDAAPNPVCLGIMFALYEKLSKDYEHVIQLYSEDDRKIIENAVDFYNQSADKLTDRKLTFGNEFF